MTQHPIPLRPDFSSLRYNREAGLPFARMLRCFLQGDDHTAKDFARARYGSKSQVVELLDQAPDPRRKTAVAAGTTSDSTWGGPLMQSTLEIVELVRLQSVLGRMPDLRRVPMNTKVSPVTSGSSATWVEEGKPKPLSRMSFGSPQTLEPRKCVAILVVTQELIRSNDPVADTVLRNDLIRALTAGVDTAFLDSTAGDGARPAGVGYGVVAVNANISLPGAWVGLAIDNGWRGDPTRAVFCAAPQAWCMIADTISGQNVGLSDGIFLRRPALSTPYCENNMIFLVDPGMVMLAEGPDIGVDRSEHATLQFDSAPDSPPTSSTVLLSLWQENYVGLRLDRSINWLAPAGSVAALTFNT